VSEDADDDAPPAGPLRRPGLARAAETGLQRDLDAMIADRLMARSDVGNAIALDLDASAGLALPTLGDIQQAPERTDAPLYQSLQQIEALLSLDKIGNLADEGGRLNELLDHGAATIEERTILRRGMLFLRRRLYKEAGEWWQLNTPADKNAPFALLLQLLQAITFRLQGDEARAAALVARLKPNLERLAGRP
jgi:hypothetical protein